MVVATSSMSWYRRERGLYTKKSEYRRNRLNKLKIKRGNIKGRLRTDTRYNTTQGKG